MIKKPLSCLVLVMIFGSVWVGSVVAQTESVPETLHFIGSLHDTQGELVADGEYTFIFRLYAGASDPIAESLWLETLIVAVERGVVNVSLGEVTPLPVENFSGTERWLGVQVQGEEEMTPRFKFSSVPYAYRSQEALVAHQLAESPLPSGMIAMFDRDCPAGWTRLTQIDGRFPRGAASYGESGGSDEHSHTIPAHSHTGNTDSRGAVETGTAGRAHTHTVNHYHENLGTVNCNCGTGCSNHCWRGGGDYNGTKSYNPTSSEANTGHQHSISAHSHSISALSGGEGTSEVVGHLPPYLSVVFCRRD